MNLLRAILRGGALTLVISTASVQSGNAAEPTAANAALLAKYVAAFNAHDAAPFKDVVAGNYIQHNGRAGQGLA